MNEAASSVSSLSAQSAIAISPCDSAGISAQDPKSLRRLLFISYAFPPTGGGGVQRSVKFTKYLPEFGWRSTVLTAANPSVPVRDSDLITDPHPSTELVHARTLEPPYGAKQALIDKPNAPRQFTLRGFVRRAAMHLLQPDPQVLWNPLALRTARGLLRKTPHEAIYVTGPPFSSFLIGRALKRRFGLPLVVDFRDEWLLTSRYLENYRYGEGGHRRQQRMMYRVLQSADVVIGVSPSMVEELARHCVFAGSHAATKCIRNGFDNDDIPKRSPSNEQSSKLRIVYTGTLWKLTDISPLVSAIETVASTSPTTAGEIQLILAGRRVPAQASVLERLKATDTSVECHDYLPHQSALGLANTADLLLLLLADSPGAERALPAKMYEYLALGKPILAICPPGEVTTLLRDFSHVTLFEPHQVTSIANWLKERVRLRNGQQRPVSYPNALQDPSIARFSRRNLTHELARLLDTVVAR